MKTICIVTGTRAEYGLLKPIIIKLKNRKNIHVDVVATGTHLSPEFGLTYREIESDGIEISKKIDILMSSDSATSISKSMALAIMGFADYFEESNPNAIMVLGDRYEMLAVCCAAMNANIPIVHLHGGETTEGAIDEAIRHSITKMSNLHFTSTEEYRRRVIQLGESPDRVFCVGAMGVENALHMRLLDRNALIEDLHFQLEKDYAVVTYHPVTLENGNIEDQIYQLLHALDEFPNMNFIITKANADANGRIINALVDEYAKKNKNVLAVHSLGVLRYLSAVKFSTMVIGNSSSGIIEAPSFGIPTVNIGDRQKGRIQADSVLNCKPFKQDIIEAIQKALSSKIQASAKDVENPYGNGQTSNKIIEIVEDFILNNKFELMKKFYDIEYEL